MSDKSKRQLDEKYIMSYTPTTESEARRIAQVLRDLVVDCWGFKPGRSSPKLATCNKRLNAKEKLEFCTSLNAMGTRWFIFSTLTFRDAEAIKIHFCDWDRRVDPPLSQAPLLGTDISNMAGSRCGQSFFVDVDTDVFALERNLAKTLEVAREFFEDAVCSRRRMLEIIIDDDQFWRVCITHGMRIRTAVALSVLEGFSKTEVVDLHQRLLDSAAAERYPIHRSPEFLACVLQLYFDGGTAKSAPPS